MGIFSAPRGLLPPGGASVAAPPNTGGEASRPRTAGSLSGGPAGQWGGVGRGSSPGVSPCGIARESVPLPLPPVHEPTRGSEGSFGAARTRRLLTSASASPAKQQLAYLKQAVESRARGQV